MTSTATIPSRTDILDAFEAATNGTVLRSISHDSQGEMFLLLSSHDIAERVLLTFSQDGSISRKHATRGVDLNDVEYQLTGQDMQTAVAEAVNTVKFDI